MKEFEFLDHTADVKFRAYGESLEELFENSAKAMIGSMTDGKIEKKKVEKIKINSNNLESMMYEFLEELLFIMDSKELVFAGIKKIKIDKENFKLEGEIYFDDLKNYKFHLDVKAVTYNEMYVELNKRTWVAQVVLDV